MVNGSQGLSNHARGPRCCATRSTHVSECSNNVHRNTNHFSTQLPTGQQLGTLHLRSSRGWRFLAVLLSTVVQTHDGCRDSREPGAAPPDLLNDLRCRAVAGRPRPHCRWTPVVSLTTISAPRGGDITKPRSLLAPGGTKKLSSTSQNNSSGAASFTCVGSNQREISLKETGALNLRGDDCGTRTRESRLHRDLLLRKSWILHVKAAAKVGVLGFWTALGTPGRSCLQGLHDVLERPQLQD